MRSGLEFLRILFPETQEEFVEICATLLGKNQLDGAARSMVYLQVTRGASPTRSHAFPSESLVPTVYAFCQETNFPSQERWDKGFTAALLPDRRWGRVDIKTVNLLPNILAAQDAKEQGADEAILHRDGVATEGTKTNFFAVLNDGKDTIITHPTTHHILHGITRAILIEVARTAGLVVEERPLTLEELRDNVKEAFFTSTTSEMKPAVAIDGRPIGDGNVGSTTRRLYQLFSERIERDTTASSNV